MTANRNGRHKNLLFYSQILRQNWTRSGWSTYPSRHRPLPSEMPQIRNVQWSAPMSRFQRSAPHAPQRSKDRLPGSVFSYPGLRSGESSPGSSPSLSLPSTVPYVQKSYGHAPAFQKYLRSPRNDPEGAPNWSLFHLRCQVLPHSDSESSPLP